jgi:sec-independent protein translocase protein TatA
LKAVNARRAVLSYEQRLADMLDVGPAELLIILAIVVVLFGASRIGDLGKGLGRGIREFRKEMRDASQDEPAKPAETTSVPTITTAITTSEPKRPQTH